MTKSNDVIQALIFLAGHFSIPFFIIIIIIFWCEFQFSKYRWYHSKFPILLDVLEGKCKRDDTLNLVQLELGSNKFKFRKM